MSRPFEAAFGGTCAACDGRIRAGETVRFNTTDELIHDHCPAEAALDPGAQCPTCYTQLPLTGICGTCS